MGGGQGQSKIGQESDRAIADISLNLYKATKAIRAETISQITEGLKTGTIQDRTGEIQQLVETAMAGGAVSTQALLDAAASGGQARTPFAQKQIAAARLAGEQQAGLAPSDYISAFVRTGEPILVGQAPGLALEGLGGIANAASYQNAQNTIGSGQMIGGLAAGAGQAAASGIMYAGAMRAPGAPAAPAPPTTSSGPIYGSRA